MGAELSVASPDSAKLQYRVSCQRAKASPESQLRKPACVHSPYNARRAHAVSMASCAPDIGGMPAASADA